jgi:hypothetical protein
MSDRFSGYMTSWIGFTSSYIYNTEHAWILSLRCWSWPHSHKWTSELSTFKDSTTVVHLWICEGKSNPLSQFLDKQVHACIHLV